MKNFTRGDISNKRCNENAADKRQELKTIQVDDSGESINLPGVRLEKMQC